MTGVDRDAAEARLAAADRRLRAIIGPPPPVSRMTLAPELIVGCMSGTSLDGVDAAVVRIAGPGAMELLGMAHRPYEAAERSRIEAVLGGAGPAEAARLHAALAEWAADAIDVALELSGVRPDHLSAIAFPGQTIWHEPPLVSWQLGEPAVLAERFGVRVVHDFRSARCRGRRPGGAAGADGRRTLLRRRGITRARCSTSAAWRTSPGWRDAAIWSVSSRPTPAPVWR